jgi:D-glycero-alpha-D-manno-heptose-7-phosphate kinase
MIITRTPFRVSLFGGGTDYPPWFRRHGGAVLGTTIDKYCYISLRELPPFFEHRHKIVYSRVETVREVAEIQHPAVRAVMGEHPVPGPPGSRSTTTPTCRRAPAWAPPPPSPWA